MLFRACLFAGGAFAFAFAFTLSIIAIAVTEIHAISVCSNEDAACVPGPETEIQYISVSEMRESYDFIVVGSGVAGSIVAARLATHASHPSVLLMEAGSKASASYLSPQRIPGMVGTNQLTSIDWKYVTTPQEHMGDAFSNNEMRWPRGKVFGGSGVLNYMMFVRGHRKDWDIVMQNVEHNVSGWQWADVLPFFKKTETVIPAEGASVNTELRGTDGPIVVNYVQNLSPNRLTDEIIQAGIDNQLHFTEDHNDGNLTSLGVAYSQYNINSDGFRANSFISYMTNLVMKDPGYKNGDIRLDLLPRAFAVQVLFTKAAGADDANDIRQTATGVRFVDLDTNIEHTARLSSTASGEVILSAGAINSPQLLLLSGMGPSADLAAVNIEVVEDVPGVGNNLQDHISYFQRYFVPSKARQRESSLAQDIYTAASVDANPGMMHTSGVNAQMYFSTSFNRAEYGPDGDFPDIQVIFAQGWNSVEGYLNFKPRYFAADAFDCGDSQFPGFYADTNDAQNLVALVTLHHPKSVGWLRLKSSNPFEYPAINPNYFAVEEDVDRLVEGLRSARELIRNSRLTTVFGLKPMECRGKHGGNMYANDRKLRKYVRDLSETLYHPIGTCKYGNFDVDDMAVVNERLLLKYTSNVRVIDASVMPWQTSANTQSPTCMIGEKGAFHALQKWERDTGLVSACYVAEGDPECVA